MAPREYRTGALFRLGRPGTCARLPLRSAGFTGADRRRKLQSRCAGPSRADGGDPVLLLVTASLILAGLGAALGLKLRACRNVSSTRSVLLHVPIETAWDLVSDFPALFAAHGHGRSLLRVTTTALERGDGRAAGSVWVQGGTWEDRPYSARIEILEIEAPFLLAVRLLGDNLGS